MSSTMRILLSVLVFACMLVPAGCGGDDGGAYVCETCSDTPEALPADDHRPTGIYKGVVTGGDNTGTVRVDISSDETTGKLQLVVDGKPRTATSFSIDQQGDSTVYTFTGDGFTVVLVVAADGTVGSVTVTVDGTTLDATLAKETSESLVQAFEGTWSGQDFSGTWNFVAAGGALSGTFDGSDSGAFVGTASEGRIELTLPEGGPLGVGSQSGDSVQGTFEKSGVSGTWMGLRRL